MELDHGTVIVFHMKWLAFWLDRGANSRATDGWQTHRSSARPDRALWQREESQKSPVMVVTFVLQFHEFLWRFHHMEVRIPYL